MADLKGVKFILGSSSPRRKDLLTQIGLSFEIVKPLVEEKRLNGEDPISYVNRNSQLKAKWVRDSLKNNGSEKADAIIISADTIVLLDDILLEKPRDKDDARRMLALLSGRTHTVITSLCLLRDDDLRGEIQSQSAVKTEVTIKELSSKEICAYVDTNEPLDKAGSYAIQGQGCYMVAAINGCYHNVVGLPLTRFIYMLKEKFGVSFILT